MIRILFFFFHKEKVQKRLKAKGQWPLRLWAAASRGSVVRGFRQHQGRSHVTGPVDVSACVSSAALLRDGKFTGIDQFPPTICLSLWASSISDASFFFFTLIWLFFPYDPAMPRSKPFQLHHLRDFFYKGIMKCCLKPISDYHLLCYLVALTVLIFPIS